MRIRIFFIALLFSSTLVAQEFRGDVAVNSQQIQSNERAVFDQIQQVMNDYINNRSWTNLTLKPEERLSTNFALILKSQSRNNFGGQLNVQLSRPVFNSTYTTGLFNYVEQDFNFSYIEGQSVDFDINTFSSNLSSSLGFYAYLLMGIYFDSYSKFGGTPFFEVAQNIVQSAGSASYAGWKSSERNTRNKYWILENYTNPLYRNLREANYLYHRMGLDMMTVSQTQARNNIIGALKLVRQTNKEKLNLVAVQLFMDAKVPELVNIFTPAPEEEQREVLAIVREVSPVNAIKFKDFAGY